MPKEYDKAKKKIRDTAYREKHREELRLRNREYYRKHKKERAESKKRCRLNHPEYTERDRINSSKRRALFRRKLLDALGGRCVRCGYDDWRGLQIDHIYGGGNAERKKFKSIEAYYKNIEEHGTQKYQILCANCNQIKRYEQKESSTTSFKSKIRK